MFLLQVSIEQAFVNEDLLKRSIEGVLLGVVSSAVFLLLISRFKPRISISNHIACKNERVEGHIKQLYSFKIINKSWFYKAYDIKIKAYICESVSSQNSDDISFEDLPLRKNEQWVLPRLHFRHFWQNIFCGSKRLDSRTDYAAQFSTFSNLKSCISQKKFITFEIIAKHSLTGFSVVKTKSYKHINEIKKGNFLSGNTFMISDDEGDSTEN